MSRPISPVHAPPAGRPGGTPAGHASGTPEAAGTSPEAADAALLSARRRAILCVIGAAATFAVAAAAVKLLRGEIPVMQVVLFRNLFAIPPLVALAMATVPRAAWRGLLATRSPGWNAARIAFGLCGMLGSFYGYVTLPLATVTALGFTMPFFLTLLSVPLLGERVGWRRCSAVLVGFTGVLLMLRPWERGAGGAEALPFWPAAAVLGGAVAWALAMISIRRLGDKGESGTTIVLWFAIGGTAVGALAAIPVWVWPTPPQWALLVAIGVVSALAQLFMTAAYRGGETTLIAPFEYSGILWTMSLGFLIWGEAPRGWDFAGIGVLVASGLYIWHREVRLGIRR